jgi:hypothetical protein
MAWDTGFSWADVIDKGIISYDGVLIFFEFEETHNVAPKLAQERVT